MKKYLPLLLIILFSCESREERVNRYSKEILDSAMSNLNSAITAQSYWDSTLNDLKLIEEEEKDSLYLVRSKEYVESKQVIFNYNKERIFTEYETIKSINYDQGLSYCYDLDNKIENVKIENLKCFYLLYKQKQKLIESRKKKIDN